MATATEERTKKVAIVTYNRIGEGQYENGVIRRNGVELFVAQNGHRSKWAAFAESTDAEKKEARIRTAQRVAKDLELADMDHVYVYVGSNGGEEMIRQTRDLPARKLTYVMCDCGWSSKRRLIQELGNSNADLMECECGGRDTLARIARQVLGN